MALFTQAETARRRQRASAEGGRTFVIGDLGGSVEAKLRVSSTRGDATDRELREGRPTPARTSPAPPSRVSGRGREVSLAGLARPAQPAPRPGGDARTRLRHRCHRPERYRHRHRE